MKQLLKRSITTILLGILIFTCVLTSDLLNVYASDDVTIFASEIDKPSVKQKLLIDSSNTKKGKSNTYKIKLLDTVKLSIVLQAKDRNAYKVSIYDSKNNKVFSANQKDKLYNTYKTLKKGTYTIKVKALKNSLYSLDIRSGITEKNLKKINSDYFGDLKLTDRNFTFYSNIDELYSYSNVEIIPLIPGGKWVRCSEIDFSSIRISPEGRFYKIIKEYNENSLDSMKILSDTDKLKLEDNEETYDDEFVYYICENNIYEYLIHNYSSYDKKLNNNIHKYTCYHPNSYDNDDIVLEMKIYNDSDKAIKSIKVHTINLENKNEVVDNNIVIFGKSFKDVKIKIKNTSFKDNGDQLAELVTYVKSIRLVYEDNTSKKISINKSMNTKVF